MWRGYLFGAASALAGMFFISSAPASTTINVMLAQNPVQGGGASYGLGITFSSTDIANGQWNSPNGAGKGTISGGSSSTNYMVAGSLADLQSLAAPDWNLDVYSKQANQLVESIYTFNPGIGGVTQSQLGLAALTAPINGQVFTTATPTFQWKAVTPFPTAIDASIYSAEPAHYGQNQVDEWVNLNSDGSFTLPTALAPGRWHIQLSGDFYLGTVPFTATLQSGPDVGLSSANAYATDAFDTGADFSIALPEPGSLSMVGAVLAGLPRRWGGRR